LYKKIKGKNPALVPNCADCHGIHGATPPGVEEVSNVCGNCHANNAEYFKKSPHFQAVREVGIPRCVDCHGNHKIPYPTMEKFAGDEEGHCGYCHDSNSSAYALALEIKRSLDEAGAAIERGREKAEEVKFSGINMEYIDSELEGAENKLIEVLPVTHSLDIDQVKQLMEESKEKTVRVMAEVENIKADLHKRKQALIVVIVLVFTVVGLLYLKKRSL
jgi:hypothetical protein